jgi:hypothetical protein
LQQLAAILVMHRVEAFIWQGQRGSQNVNAEHPPNQEYRDERSCDVNDPVTDRLRFAKIEHAAMLAGLFRKPIQCLKTGPGDRDPVDLSNGINHFFRVTNPGER